MRLYPDASAFMYVSDNLKQDFIAPNALGWETICQRQLSVTLHAKSE